VKKEVTTRVVRTETGEPVRTGAEY